MTGRSYLGHMARLRVSTAPPLTQGSKPWPKLSGCSPGSIRPWRHCPKATAKRSACSSAARPRRPAGAGSNPGTASTRRPSKLYGTSSPTPDRPARRWLPLLTASGPHPAADRTFLLSGGRLEVPAGDEPTAVSGRARRRRKPSCRSRARGTRPDCQRRGPSHLVGRRVCQLFGPGLGALGPAGERRPAAGQCVRKWVVSTPGRPGSTGIGSGRWAKS